MSEPIQCETCETWSRELTELRAQIADMKQVYAMTKKNAMLLEQQKLIRELQGRLEAARQMTRLVPPLRECVRALVMCRNAWVGSEHRERIEAALASCGIKFIEEPLVVTPGPRNIIVP